MNLFEVMVVISITLIVAVVLLSALAKSHRHPSRLWCANNLKQVDLACRIWAGDNGDKYPPEVAVTNGGAREWIGVENWKVFQVMSNELSTPQILFCRQDELRSTCATNFSDDLKDKISYFVGLEAKENDPQALLSGDANLVVNGTPVSSGIWDLRTCSATWTKARHDKSGYIVMADGSIQLATRIGSIAAAGTIIATNRLAIP